MFGQAGGVCCSVDRSADFVPPGESDIGMVLRTQEVKSSRDRAVAASLRLLELRCGSLERMGNGFVRSILVVFSSHSCSEVVVVRALLTGSPAFPSSYPPTRCSR